MCQQLDDQSLRDLICVYTCRLGVARHVLVLIAKGRVRLAVPHQLTGVDCVALLPRYTSSSASINVMPNYTKLSQHVIECYLVTLRLFVIE
jgi:hypothetical protein